jgi:hypothetical protein
MFEVALVSLVAVSTAAYANDAGVTAAADEPPRAEKTLVASNPVGLYLGQLALSVSRAVHDRVAVRGDAILIDNNVLRGASASVSVAVYVADVFDGPFVEPGFMVRRGRSKFMCDGGEMCGAESLTGPQVMVGWHWTFGPGVSIAAAVGAIYDLGDRSDFLVDADTGLAPTAYLNTGFAF